MSPVLTRYLDKVIKDNQTIDARGVMQVNRMIELSMDEVFIDLTVRMGKASNGILDHLIRSSEALLAMGGKGSIGETQVRVSSTLLNAARNANISAQELKFAQDTITEPFTTPSIETGIPTIDLWTRSNTWVLLGDPGAGKTTLLKHFALKNARECKQGQGYLPVLLPLRLFAAEWEQQPKWLEKNAVLNYLADKGLSEMGFEQAQERKELLGYIEQALSNGRALFLFDGLDEQRDAASQRKSVAAIESLLFHNFNNRILVSSRILGYDAAPLSAGFNTATLEPFSDEQMEAFFRQWILAVEKQEDIVVDERTEKRAKEQADELIAQIKANAGIRTLTTNPLLCTIIGLIRRQGATLPQLRAELYKLCIDTFIFNWELQKRRRPDQDNSLDKDQTQAVLEELALHFHENCPENREPQQAISEVIKNFLVKQQGMAADAAATKAGQLLSLIRDVSGLLINRGNDEFGFFHLTFQEYLTARAITRRKRDIERYLRQHLFEPRWREVIRLAAAHQGMKDEETGSEFIEAILRCKHPREELMHYAFRIAFLCLKEARVLLETSDAMLREWIQIYLVQPEIQELLLQLMKQPGAEIRHYVDSLQPLLDAIKDRDSDVRISAAKALAQCKDPVALQALLEAIKDEHRDVRSRAAEALAKFKDPAALQALLGAIKDEDSMVRMYTAVALSPFKEPALQALLGAIKDKDRSVRWGASAALTHFKDPAALHALRGAIKDKDSDVCRIAVGALAQFNEPEALQALLGAIKDKDSDVRSSAARALALFKDPAALQALLGAIKDEHCEVRKGAAEALSQFKNPVALQALLGAIKDENGFVRRGAAEALAQFKDPAALQALLGMIKDKHIGVRMGTVEALAQFRDPAALQALLGAIKDEDSNVRSYTARALGQFKDPAALQALLGAIKDEDGLVRMNASTALAQFKNPAAFMALLGAIKDEHPYVRNRAAEALAQFKDPLALQALLGAVKDEYKDSLCDVHMTVVYSIEQIDLGAALCPV
ncbi:MAG: HEAT repeat domain-containing protein [Sideroxydans sp.]|nr:HEAT repeat domain-containing protein [Sideroxydans sp.]